MQFINNDMDELMRRAAEHYPVKPKGADWESVLQRLNGPEPAPAEQKDKRDFKRFFFLFSFLLASLVCNKYFWFHHASGIDRVNEAGQQHSAAARDKKETVTGAFSTTTFFNQQKGKQNIAEMSYTPNGSRVSIANSATDKEDLLIPSGSEARRSRRSSAPLLLRTRAAANEHSFFAQQQLVQSTLQLPEDNSALKERIKLSRPKKLYASLLAGPDVSSVKLQEVNRVGYSIGFLLGYRFNKSWTVETGVLWDKKNYYSDGNSFKTNKVYLPSHSRVLQVDGYCNMFELPLNIKYNFKQSSRSNWFASTGVSSYLMQKEDYDYVYERYNVKYKGTAYYNQSSRNWLSILNVSAGYEHRLPAGGRIRIEPYIKLPLQGVGIGSMPLSSSGIMVGVSYPLH